VRKLFIIDVLQRGLATTARDFPLVVGKLASISHQVA
jgi:hypothetical protein